MKSLFVTNETMATIENGEFYFTHEWVLRNEYNLSQKKLKDDELIIFYNDLAENEKLDLMNTVKEILLLNQEENEWEDLKEEIKNKYFNIIDIEILKDIPNNIDNLFHNIKEQHNLSSGDIVPPQQGVEDKNELIKDIKMIKRTIKTSVKIVEDIERNINCVEKKQNSIDTIENIRKEYEKSFNIAINEYISIYGLNYLFDKIIDDFNLESGDIFPEHERNIKKIIEMYIKNNL